MFGKVEEEDRGIDCDVKMVFRCVNSGTYTLNMDNIMTKVHEDNHAALQILLPLTSDPKNINNAVFKYNSDLIRNENRINTGELTIFNGWHGIIRIYRDVFLNYDCTIDSWVLFRIITP